MDHFESIAAVCKCNDEAKLKWLRVRLTGRAGSAFRRLPEETCTDFKERVKVLQEQFEPESKKELYRAELQTRIKKRNEDWAVFGDDLKLLTDRAYPDLPDEAREWFTLNQHLTQLDNAQVVFGVRQAKPKVVDEAVRLTLEMEPYLQPTRPSRTLPTLAGNYNSDLIGAASNASNTGIGAILSQVLEGGGERVIAYGSRMLSKQELRYCVTRRQLLAMVSFLQQFRLCLLGRPFLIQTDHGSLTWLSNFKEPEGQLAGVHTRV